MTNLWIFHRLKSILSKQQQGHQVPMHIQAGLKGLPACLSLSVNKVPLLPLPHPSILLSPSFLSRRPIRMIPPAGCPSLKPESGTRQCNNPPVLKIKVNNRCFLLLLHIRPCIPWAQLNITLTPLLQAHWADHLPLQPPLCHHSIAPKNGKLSPAIERLSTPT